eukprot:gene32084-42819_t
MGGLKRPARVISTQPVPAMTLVSIPANPVPDDVVSGTIKTPDGAELRFARWAPPAGRKGTVCVFTGRGESIEKYFETVRDLRDRGFAGALLEWPRPRPPTRPPARAPHAAPRSPPRRGGGGRRKEKGTDRITKTAAASSRTGRRSGGTGSHFIAMKKPMKKIACQAKGLRNQPAPFQGLNIEPGAREIEEVPPVEALTRYGDVPKLIEDIGEAAE